jgi:iron complex transport system substrate-binding protein
MKNTVKIIWIFTLIAALIGGGCQVKNTPQGTEPNPIITLTDGLGRTITLDKPAQRIVSLAPPNTEILFAIGAGSQVIGRDSFSDYPAAAKSVQDIGGSSGKYNQEAIVTLKPDLVLAGEINTPEMVGSLEKLGLKVFYLKNPTNLDGMYSMVQMISQLSGHEKIAGELIKSWQQRVSNLQSKLANITFRPTVFYELDASDPAKPYTPGPGTFYTTLIDLAGGQNVGATLNTAWAQISLEQVLLDNPQYILLGDAMWGVTADSIAKRAGWNTLTAVKEGRVLPFDDNLLSRIGPRQIDGLETLAKILHPEAFK